MNTNRSVIGDTYSITPTMFLDLRASFSRYHHDRAALSAGYDLTQLGWPSSPSTAVAVRVQPIPIVTGYSGVFATNGTGSAIIARNDIFSLSPNITKIRGKHTIKFGGEGRRGTHNDYQQNNPSGSFNFDAIFTSVNPLAAAGTGNGFASFLLGCGSGGGLTHNSFVAGQMIYRGYYIGRQMQVNSKLTLNFGIRYEQMGPWSERFDRLVVLLPNADNERSGRGGLNFKGRFGLVNSPDSPSRNSTGLRNVFSPRLGLAYRLSNKTVFRTGWSVF